MAESTAYSRRGVIGGAKPSTVVGDLNNSTTTIPGADLSTWAGASANGPITWTINRGKADEESGEATAVSGNNLTGCTRGLFGTTAQEHDAGATLELTSSKRDFDEANYTTSETVGKITAANQILVGDGANSLAALTVAASRIVARLASGDVVAATPAEILTLIAALPLAGGTMTGGLVMADQLLTRALLKDYGEEVQAHGNTGTTETIDIENGNVHTITLDDNCTLTFSNPTATGDCCSFTLIVLQDATGSRAITWPASVKWAGGAAPTLTTTASRYDVFTFVTVDAGARWFGFTSGLNFQ